MRTSIGLLLLALCACAQQPPSGPDVETLRSQLLEADRTFDRLTQERGSEGWVSTFLPDGRMLLDRGPIVEGAGAIRDAMSVLDDPSFSLTWEPLGADVGTGGDLGYTWGRYRRSATREDGETTVAEGKYLTVWKRDRNGVWKVAADIGNSGAPEPPPSAVD